MDIAKKPTVIMVLPIVLLAFKMVLVLDVRKATYLLTVQELLPV